jgi:hypothetical protein
MKTNNIIYRFLYAIAPFFAIAPFSAMASFFSIAQFFCYCSLFRYSSLLIRLNWFINECAWKNLAKLPESHNFSKRGMKKWRIVHKVTLHDSSFIHYYFFKDLNWRLVCHGTCHSITMQRSLLYYTYVYVLIWKNWPNFGEGDVRKNCLLLPRIITQ